MGCPVCHTQLQSQKPYLTLSSITQRKISILHWLGRLPWGSICPQAELPGRYASWPAAVMPPKLALMISPHDMIMKLEAQFFCVQSSSRATFHVGQFWGIFHHFATPEILVLVPTKLHKVLQRCLCQFIVMPASGQTSLLACWKSLSPSIMLDNNNHNSGLKPRVKCSSDATVQVRQLWAAHSLSSLKLFQSFPVHTLQQLQRRCSFEAVLPGWSPKAIHGLW